MKSTEVLFECLGRLAVMFTPDFSPHEVTFPEGECIPEGASEILFLLFCSGALLSKVYILFCMYETVNFCFL